MFRDSIHIVDLFISMPYFALQALAQVTTSTITTIPSLITRANNTTTNNTFLNYENNSTLGIKMKVPSD